MTRGYFTCIEPDKFKKLNQENISYSIDLLAQEGYFSEATRAIVISGTLHDLDTQIYTSINILVEITQTVGIKEIT